MWVFTLLQIMQSGVIKFQQWKYHGYSEYLHITQTFTWWFYLNVVVLQMMKIWHYNESYSKVCMHQ